MRHSSRSFLPHRPHRAHLPKAVRIVGFGLLALGTLSATGCSFHSSGPEKVDLNAFAFERELSAPGTVTIRSLNGPIDVKPATGSTLSVTAETRWRRGNPKRDLKFVAQSNGNDVLICAIWGRGDCTKEGSRRGGTGGISMGGLFKKGTDASVHFTVNVPAGLKVNVVTVNGGVNVASTAPVYARTVNGNIKVGTAVGPVDAETVNGSVDARMTTLSGDGPVRAHTLNGTAVAFLPSTFDANVNVQTVNGSAASEFAFAAGGDGTRRTQINGVIGTGGRSVDVRSVNGSAFLRRLNADGTVAAAVAVATKP